MNPLDLGRATRPAVTTVSSKFMIDGPTYARGAELGFAGADFYVGGRGGALGEVSGDVVAAAFVFFEPTTVREAWERAGSVMSRAEAAAAFAACGHAWAEQHLAGVGAAAATVVELGGRVIAATNPAGAPMFAAWRGLPVPADPVPAALHTLNALRELRAAYHGGAVLAAGLSPDEALAVNNPGMAVLFGWTEPLPSADPHEAAWRLAEEATDLAIGRALSVLGDDEQEALVSACATLHTAAG